MYQCLKHGTKLTLKCNCCKKKLVNCCCSVQGEPTEDGVLPQKRLTFLSVTSILIQPLRIRLQLFHHQPTSTSQNFKPIVSQKRNKKYFLAQSFFQSNDIPILMNHFQIFEIFKTLMSDYDRIGLSLLITRHLFCSLTKMFELL